MKRARFFPVVFAGILAGMPLVAHAQDYPTDAIRVVIPHGAGGTNDIAGRLIFNKISDLTGARFIIENRAGAGSTIGEGVVAASPADGYTVMVHSITLVSNAHLGRGQLPHDPRTDFTPVAPLADQTGIIAVNTSVPATTIEELIDLAQSDPGTIMYSSAGAGSYMHMALGYFDAMAETDMVHVPYSGGSDASLALAQGDVHVNVATVATWAPFLARGDVRFLAAVSEERMEAYPDLPTANETVPGYAFPSWVGVFAPAGTPQEAVEWLDGAIKEAQADPELLERFAELNLTPLTASTEEFAERIEADHARYEDVMATIEFDAP